MYTQPSANQHETLINLLRDNSWSNLNVLPSSCELASTDRPIVFFSVWSVVHTTYITPPMEMPPLGISNAPCLMPGTVSGSHLPSLSLYKSSTIFSGSLLNVHASTSRAPGRPFVSPK